MTGTPTSGAARPARDRGQDQARGRGPGWIVGHERTKTGCRGHARHAGVLAPGLLSAVAIVMVVLAGCGTSGLGEWRVPDPFSLDGAAVTTVFQDGAAGSGWAESTYRPWASPSLPPAWIHLHLALAPDVGWSAGGPTPAALTVVLDWTLELGDGGGTYLYLVPAGPTTVTLVGNGASLNHAGGTIALEADVPAVDVADFLALVTGDGDHRARLLLLPSVDPAVAAGAGLAFTVEHSEVTMGDGTSLSPATTSAATPPPPAPAAPR